MRREFARLAEGPFDLLVIGGGVYGAWTAYDAALRGLRVALIEQSDWAAGTSSASSKLVHGGLRYLEQGRFRLVRGALDERRRLAHAAPHRVRPVRMVIPVYADDRLGRLRTRAGLWLYDHLAGADDQPVGRTTALGSRELIAHFSFLAPDGLRGGFSFGDCLTDDARFTLEIVDGAFEAGVTAVNRARAVELLREGRRVVGARVLDLAFGRSLDLRSGVTVCCAGPWYGETTAGLNGSAPVESRLTRGVHLVLPALPCEEAFLIPVRGERRVVFLIPWYGRTLLGTTDSDYEGAPDDARVGRVDIAYLLAQANRVLRGAPWSERDVISSFCGLRVLPGARNGSTPPSDASREWVLVQPAEGLLASVGGKLTSARSDASRIVDLALRVLGRSPIACPTADRRFPWAPEERFARWTADTLARGLALGLDEEAARTCADRHGTRTEQVFEWIARERFLAGRIVPELPFCLAELIYAFEAEMASSLEDALRRRLPLLVLTRLSRSTLDRIANELGAELGWTAERRRREVAAILVGPHAPRRGVGAL